MDKNIIKKYLAEKFLHEGATPGIDIAKDMKTKEVKINTAANKESDKNMKAYDKTTKGKSKDDVVKFNATDDEKVYHDQMEILNGQEMVEYDLDPSKEFKEKAKKAITGDSKMGNENGIGNAEPTWGASDENFGKDKLKNIAASAKKRANAEVPYFALGTDVESIKKGTHPKQLATENKNNKPQIKETMKRLKFKKEFNGVGNALKLIPESYKVDGKEFEMTDSNENYTIKWEGSINEGKAVILKASNKTMVNEDMDRMKALFNYKSEDTLGLVKGKARLNENDGFTDVWNKTKKMLVESDSDEMMQSDEDDVNESDCKDMEEDINETENIEGQKPSKIAPFEEAGTPVAPEVPAIHKKSLQSKDGTAPAASVKDASKAVSVAPEVPAVHKQKLQTKDGTAPSAPVGHWEDINETENIEGQKPSKTAPFDKAGTPVAPEVPAVHKKSLQSKDGTAPAAPTKVEAGIAVAPEVPAVHKQKLQTKDGTAPAPKADNLGDAGIGLAADAKKHVNMHESFGEEEETNSYDAGTEEDMGSETDVAEPMQQIKLLRSLSSGNIYLEVNGKNIKVPEELKGLAMKDPKAAYAQMS